MAIFGSPGAPDISWPKASETKTILARIREHQHQAQNTAERNNRRMMWAHGMFELGGSILFQILKLRMILVRIYMDVHIHAYICIYIYAYIYNMYIYNNIIQYVYYMI